MHFKGLYQLGSTASLAGTTVGWPTFPLFNSSEYSKCDVLVKLSTFSGSSFSLSFQEVFSDQGYLETVNTGSISAAGVYWLSHDISSKTGTTTNSVVAYSPILGKGREKRFVTGVAGTVGTLNCTVYVLPYED